MNNNINSSQVQSDYVSRLRQVEHQSRAGTLSPDQYLLFYNLHNRMLAESDCALQAYREHPNPTQSVVVQHMINKTAQAMQGYVELLELLVNDFSPAGNRPPKFNRDWALERRVTGL